MRHPMVLPVSQRPWGAFDLYIGRRSRTKGCPCMDPGCGHLQLSGDLGNPFRRDPRAPLDPAPIFAFVDMLEGLQDPGHLPFIRETVRGRVLRCWCPGRHDLCHGYPLAWLGEGLDLPEIRRRLIAVVHARGGPEPDQETEEELGYREAAEHLVQPDPRPEVEDPRPPDVREERDDPHDDECPPGCPGDLPF